MSGGDRRRKAEGAWETKQVRHLLRGKVPTHTTKIDHIMWGVAEVVSTVAVVSAWYFRPHRRCCVKLNTAIAADVTCRSCLARTAVEGCAAGRRARVALPGCRSRGHRTHLYSSTDLPHQVGAPLRGYDQHQRKGRRGMRQGCCCRGNASIGAGRSPYLHSSTRAHRRGSEPVHE